MGARCGLCVEESRLEGGGKSGPEVMEAWARAMATGRKEGWTGDVFWKSIRQALAMMWIQEFRERENQGDIYRSTLSTWVDCGTIS